MRALLPAGSAADAANPLYEMDTGRVHSGNAQGIDLLAVLFLNARKNSSSLSSSSSSLSSLLLRPGTVYRWRVRVWLGHGACVTPWSDEGVIVTGLHAGFSNDSVPIWAPDTSASYAYARFEAVLPMHFKVAHATAYVTGDQSGSQEKLLGAYRLYIGGITVAIGPGRAPVAVGAADHYIYDTVDVTEPVIRSIATSSSSSSPFSHSSSSSSTFTTTNTTSTTDTNTNTGKGNGGEQQNVLALGLQGYSDDAIRHHDGRMLLELHLVSNDGTRIVVPTNASWLSFSADGVYNPTQTTGGAYHQPREYIDADKVQAGWQTVGFKAGSGWAPATVQPRHSPGTLTAKSTLPLSVRYVRANVTQLAPDHWFIDFGTEVMAGVHLETTGGAPASQLDLRLGEELISPNTILYPMRTGNTYQNTFTTRRQSTNTSRSSSSSSSSSSGGSSSSGSGGSGGSGGSSDGAAVVSVFEHHEYMLFRYGELRSSGGGNSSGNGGTCGIVPEQSTLELSCATAGSSVTNHDNGSNYSSINDAKITRIVFASYGTPSGSCDVHGSSPLAIDPKCNSLRSMDVVKAACLGKSSCKVMATNDVFGGDPCHYTTKKLAARVECSGGPSPPPLPPPSPPAPSPTPTPLSVNVTGWQVHYPWRESDSAFESSNTMLNQVWALCQNTLRVTSLDTFTDSNTRERLPYEADGFITGSSRQALQGEYAWVAHSARHNFANPTWPTEWRQTTPLLAQLDYMESGDASLARDNWDLLVNNTQLGCYNASIGLVDFRHCARMSGTRDVIDWPEASRDGYKLTDVSTVISAYAVGAARALVSLASVAGASSDEAARLNATASAVAAGVNARLWAEVTGAYTDGLDVDHSAFQATVYPLWHGLVPPERQAAVLKFMQSKRMRGSVYAAFGALLGLYSLEDDHGALALDLMTTCDKNSWCTMLRNGATATQEAWTTDEKPNLSWSHPWASAPATAIARGFMGLRPLQPAYREFMFMPQPGNVTSASMTLPTVAGSIQASFSQPADGGSFMVSLSSPGNTLATVCLPRLGSTSDNLEVDGKIEAGFARGDYACVRGLGPGKHMVMRDHTM